MNHKRILLKLSGEALSSNSSILDRNILNGILNQVKILINEYGLEIGIVVGGGNIFRGQISQSIGLGEDTAPADYMGMLATTINAIGLNSFFNKNGVESKLQNSLKIENVSSGINVKAANKFLSEKKVVIFGGGTGKPYLSTDTAAAMRAIEIKADAILMAKNGVDGVYDDDPLKNANAQFIPELSFQDVIKNKLRVVDLEAMELLKNQKIDLILFNMNTPNNIISLYKNKYTKKTIIKEK
ncbi:MAG: uridylate kinase [Candidatus Tyloplasma litorale]|nr:MAG: uridylate kinase [Mycoplasmatales bacterium]